MLSTFGTLLAPPPLVAWVTITLGAEANRLDVNVTVVPEALIACDANVSTIGGGLKFESILPVVVNVVIDKAFKLAAVKTSPDENAM